MEPKHTGSLRNPTGYDKARNETENRMIKDLMHVKSIFGRKIKTARQSTQEEDMMHIDIVVEFEDGGMLYIDVKDQEKTRNSDNRGRSTYCVSEHEKNFIEDPANSDLIRNYCFACVQYDKRTKIRTDRWLILFFKDVSIFNYYDYFMFDTLCSTAHLLQPSDPQRESNNIQFDLMSA